MLKGTTNLDYYPEVDIRSCGTDDLGTAALVNANGVTDLDISGEGTIDGSGERREQNNPRRPAGGAPGRPTPRRVVCTLPLLMNTSITDPSMKMWRPTVSPDDFGMDCSCHPREGAEDLKLDTQWSGKEIRQFGGREMPSLKIARWSQLLLR